MANKKFAPNRDKHSAAKEAVESALQLARSPLPGTRRRAPPFASDADESTAPSPKNTASSPANNTAPSSAKDQAPASSSEGESDDAPAPAKNTASASAKNKAPVPDKNKASASAKNEAPVPDKNKASASPIAPAAPDEDEVVVPAAPDEDEVVVPAAPDEDEVVVPAAPDEDEVVVPAAPDEDEVVVPAAPDEDEVVVPAAPDEDEVAAPPQDTALRRFINFLCDKASALPWRELLDAFLTWVHSSARGEAQAEAPTESSAYQEQREKGFLEEAENTQQQAADQLPENGRDFDEAEADRIIPAGPSISKIVEDHQNFDPYLSSDIHKDYVKIMSSCPPGMEVCVFCYFEKDSKTQRSQSRANSFSNKTRKRVVSGLPVALWKWNTINLIRALHFFRMSKARRKPSKDAKAEFPDL
ncbi:translation initiation factor IF-2-like isoform X2 [Hordeum vulgare subsp. vulgare]|uniref:translation initiation factor IF-2-like isoform X2 n=1 Tax=Hordeum vulgare subsp. vulgare TaxID=112509 RepID=UPI001D1A345A|nr:translation initiation factor IF-2-like isoform X2 [Hordeum vulgare subsp. vulgare]